MASAKTKKRQGGSPKPHLRQIDGGKESRAETTGLEELFSSTVTRATASAKKKRKKGEIAPIALPESLGKYADLYASGKAIEKELRVKIAVAKSKLREFCQRNLVHLLITTKRKPTSIDYVAEHSKLKFVQTNRTTLSPEKVELLRAMNVPIDDYTELVGMDINMEEIRRHGLEKKLMSALSEMKVSKAVLEEILVPKRQLNPSFYDNLYTIVRESLQGGEKEEEKAYQVFSILEPSEQMRNVEIKDMELQDCFDLVIETEIETEDFGDEEDDAA